MIRYLIVLHKYNWATCKIEASPYSLTDDINMAHNMADFFLKDDHDNWYIFNTSYSVEETNMNNTMAKSLRLL